MNKIVKYAGFVWAFPVTFFGLLYVLLFWALGWYKWHKSTEMSLVWTFNFEKSPVWLRNTWRGWAGQAVGNVVVLSEKGSQDPRVLTHELKHVDQVMRLGVFQPIVYLLCLIAIKIGCPGSNPYFSNPFEIDARRAAGQIVDVEGQLKQLKEKLTQYRLKK